MLHLKPFSRKIPNLFRFESFRGTSILSRPGGAFLGQSRLKCLNSNRKKAIFWGYWFRIHKFRVKDVLLKSQHENRMFTVLNSSFHSSLYIMTLNILVYTRRSFHKVTEYFRILLIWISINCQFENKKLSFFTFFEKTALSPFYTKTAVKRAVAQFISLFEEFLQLNSS